MTEPRMSRRNTAMPLEQFTAAKQREIAAAVAEPRPPGRWIGLGGDCLRPDAQIESRAWWEWHWQRGIDPERRREKLPVGLRDYIINRDGLICGLCGGAVERPDVHIDHIKPLAHGGPTEAYNLQVTHSRCNMSKGAKV